MTYIPLSCFFEALRPFCSFKLTCVQFRPGGALSVHLHTSDDGVAAELLWHKVIKFITEVRLKQIRESIRRLFFCP